MIYYFGNECDKDSICYTYDIELSQKIASSETYKQICREAGYYSQCTNKEPDSAWNQFNSFEEFCVHFNSYVKEKILILNEKIQKNYEELKDIEKKVHSLILTEASYNADRTRFEGYLT